MGSPHDLSIRAGLGDVTLSDTIGGGVGIDNLSIEAENISVQTVLVSSLAAFDVGVSGSVGAISDAGGLGAAVSKSGVGKLSLTSVNTYSGTTTVSAGDLALSGAGQLGSGSYAGAIAIASGSSFEYGSSADQILSGIISGAGDIAVSGAGTVTLSGVNTYSGTTTVSAGDLALSGAGQLGSGSYAGAIAIASGSSFEYGSSADQILSGIISGAGDIAVSGAGTVTLSGVNTYSGTTTVSAGQLELGGVDRLSDSSSLVVSGGIFDLGGYSDTVSAVQLTGGSITNGTLTSAATFDVQSGTTSASSVLVGSNGLTKTGCRHGDAVGRQYLQRDNNS